jgi:hypothetical protein
MITQALTFNLISGFHLIACFKAEIRAGLMKKEGHLTTQLALIKNEALQIELVLEKKSSIGANGTNGNVIKPVLINQIQEDNQNQVEAIKGNNYRPYQNNQTHQGQPNQVRNNGPAKCTHYKKLGHVMEKGFVKFLSLRRQNQKTEFSKNLLQVL